MNRKLIFWSIVIILICTFFYSVRDILFPFVTGLLIAYLFDPVADKMEEKKIPRGAAAGIIVLGFFAILIAFLIFFGPILFEQLESLVKKVPDYMTRFKTEIMPYIKQKVAQIDPELLEKAQAKAENNGDQFAEWLSKFMGSLLQSWLWLFNIISLLAITPFVAFYILRDWDKFIAKIDSLLPREYAQKIRTQAKKIDDTISAFLRGQLNVCLILGVFYSIALTIAGLNYGLLIGFISGMLCFIPYVGTFVGVIIGISVAYFQYGPEDLHHIAIIAGIYGFGQIAEGNFLTPKIVGDKVGVHPAWLIFGMLAGGTLLGFIGILIAVPLTAAIGVLVKFVIDEYENSGFYKKNATPKSKSKSKSKKAKS